MYAPRARLRRFVFAAAILVAALAVSLPAGCRTRGRGDEGAVAFPRSWRDQFIFLGDDVALVIGVHRHSAGRIELKGWLGVGGRWRAALYDEAALDPAVAPDLAASLADYGSRRERAPVRVSIARETDELRVEARAPSLALELVATGLVPIGEHVDPEGTVHYRVGSGGLAFDGRAVDGLLITEESAALPLHATVEYGDFLFVAARLPGGDDFVVGKASRERSAFDVLFGRIGGKPVAGRSPRPFVLDGDAVRVALDAPASLAVRDRSTTRGATLDYEALLLGGGGRSGVAFHIAPTLNTPPPR